MRTSRTENPARTVPGITFEKSFTVLVSISHTVQELNVY